MTAVLDNELLWHTEPPTTEGLWEYRTPGTDMEPVQVRIYTQDGALWVHDETIGNYPVRRMQTEIEGIQWRLFRPAPGKN